METAETIPPWKSKPDSANQVLSVLHQELKDALSSGRFVDSQHRTAKNIPEYLDGYLWREYFVVTSVQLASRSVENGEKLRMAEGGVCDGIGAWFALGTAAKSLPDFEYWAYDSWAPMREKELLDSELRRIGKYDYLSFEQTKLNLQRFADYIVFCKGFVPQSLKKYDGPMTLHWLHIDINAAKPTEMMLSHFWGRIPKRGVVLLDDYSWRGYVEMKTLIDKFLQKRGGMVIALPTGQGFIIKND